MWHNAWEAWCVVSLCDCICTTRKDKYTITSIKLETPFGLSKYKTLHFSNPLYRKFTRYNSNNWVLFVKENAKLSLSPLETLLVECNVGPLGGVLSHISDFLQIFIKLSNNGKNNNYTAQLQMLCSPLAPPTWRNLPSFFLHKRLDEQVHWFVVAFQPGFRPMWFPIGIAWHPFIQFTQLPTPAFANFPAKAHKSRHLQMVIT